MVYIFMFLQTLIKYQSGVKRTRYHTDTIYKYSSIHNHMTHWQVQLIFTVCLHSFVINTKID